MAYAYVGVFLTLFCSWPLLLFVVTKRELPGSTSDWFLVIVPMVLLAAALAFAERCCSDEKFSFGTGLIWVAVFMSTGWPYVSMLVVFPILLVVVLASIGFAGLGIITGSSATAPTSFQHLVRFFHQHRMRQ